MLKSPLSTRPVIEALEARIAPATFIVTTAADSGPGSLRQAILDANALSGADTIDFGLEGDQLHVISVLSQLPAITDQLKIQAAVGKIRIDGSQAGEGVSGLILSGTTGSTISGLEIVSFSGNGVRIEEGNSNTLSDNTIFGNAANGVHIIGGQLSRLSGNTINSNHLSGVLLENTTNTSINSNASYYTENTLPGGNTIRDNGLFGVEIRGGGMNKVWGNKISGNGVRHAEGVNGGGIGIIDSPSNEIGGHWTGWHLSEFGSVLIGNEIVENRGVGILISGSTSAHTHLFENSITGTLGDGIRIDSAPSTDIGTLETVFIAGRGSWTVLSGNTVEDSQGWNIAVLNFAAQTKIRGNTIEGGTLGGVLIDKSDSAQIGGSGTYDSNTFSNNLGNGVTVRDSIGVGIIWNRFTGNTGMPVDLGDDGQTPNDPTDTDGRANNLQNYPVITAVGRVMPSGSFSVDVGGTLATELGAGTYRVELYAWSSANVYTRLRAFDVTTNDQGVAQISRESVSVPAGTTHVSAVAISASGDSSEFAPPTLIQPKLSVAGQTLTEGNSDGIATVTVSLSFEATEPVVVQYRTGDGTAIAGSDYSAVEGTITFAPGETTKTIQIPVLGDTDEELSETFYLDILSVLGASATNTRGTIELKNDDGIPTINIEDATVIEGGTSSGSGLLEVKYKVTLNKPSLAPVTVQLGTASGGTATPSSSGDYYMASMSLVFQPGQTEAYATLYVVDDAAREFGETVKLQLRNAQNGVIGQGDAVLTIVDNDSWELQTDSVRIVEGTDGQRNALVTVRLVGVGPTATRDHTVSLNYATAAGTASAGTDFSDVQGTLTFSPEESVQVISVPILGDSLPEPDEFLKVLFSSPLGATLPSPEAIITIEDEDPITVSVTGGSITEDDAGTQLLTFTVSLAYPAQGVVSVDYSSVDQSAKAGTDYDAIAGQLVFAPGETTKTITVPIRGDDLAEASETFLLRLTNSVGALLHETEASGIIMDDDSLPTVTNSGRKATWTDSDGDIVTLTATKKGALHSSLFYFEYSSEGGPLLLQQLNLTSGSSGGLGLKFSVQKSATGDGLVHVGSINAEGRDLTEISLPGRLGSIVAGDEKLKTPAIRKLTVNSFGLDSVPTEAGAIPLLSEVNGSMGTLLVKRDFIGANLSVIGGGIQTLSIGGSLLGTAADTPTGISVEKSLMNLRVGGDIRGSDPLHPVEISTSTVPLARATLALKDLRVAGDVANTNIIAGANSLAAVSVGKILVRGDWSASNLAVGAEAGPDELFGTDDDIPYQSAVSRIAQIVIRGDVTGTEEAVSETDHFGFVAGRIAAFQVGAGKVPLSAKWKDSIEIGTTSDVTIRELAGRTRLS